MGLALLDPLEQGWMRGTVNNILTPVMLPKSSVPLAPDYISTMIKCSCDGVRTEDQPEAHAYHLRSLVPSSAGATA